MLYDWGSLVIAGFSCPLDDPRPSRKPVGRDASPGKTTRVPFAGQAT